MINIIICDDEIKQRFLLKKVVEEEFKVHNYDYKIYEFSSGERLLDDFIKDRNKFDIIFLDIEMEKINGIETAKKIREFNQNAVIIFVTGFSDYVFDGYGVKALNYIMKPYKKEKIVCVLKEALVQFENESSKYYIIKNEGNIVKVPIKDILYFASDRRKILLITDYKKYEFYGKLGDVEEKCSNEFNRIHQRYLVNLSHITAIKDNNLVINNKNLPISRQRHKSVMLAFANQLLK